jgi:hypothetical protein
MRLPIDTNSRVQLLLAMVDELDRTAESIGRTLTLVPTIEAAPAAPGADRVALAGRVAGARATAGASLRRILADRPRILALLAASHGPGPRD